MENTVISFGKDSDLIADRSVNTTKEGSFDTKIVVMDKQECIFIKIGSIYYVEADGAYSILYLHDGRKMVVSKNVKVFSSKLPEYHFCRIHKSYLVNVNYISKYVKSDGGYIIMENGTMLPVSVRKKDSLMQLVDHLAL